MLASQPRALATRDAVVVVEGSLGRLQLPYGSVGNAELEFSHVLSDEKLSVFTVHELKPEALHHFLETCKAVLDNAILVSEPSKPLVAGGVPEAASCIVFFSEKLKRL